MRVKCTKNTAAEIGEPRTGIHYGTDYVFDVEANHVYEVYAMSLFQDGLQFLVSNRYGRPDWFPIGLFEVIDGALPKHWEFASFPDARNTAFGRPGLQAAWGYHEITIPAHISKLNELDSEALEVFERERRG